MHGYGQDGVSSFLVFQSQGQYSSLWDCREWKKERSISITIVEDKYSVDESGRLIIPVEAIHEMGLDIGDDVFVSFISNGQEANVYRELLIASASLQELDSAPKIVRQNQSLFQMSLWKTPVLCRTQTYKLSADKVSCLLQHRLR